MTDPIWWLYLFWIPDFLNRNHGLDLNSIGPAPRRHLPHRRRGQHRRRLAVLHAHQARLERQRRAQDGHAHLRPGGGADHLRVAGAEPVGGGAAGRPRRGRAPGLVGQPLHARLRHVPAPRRRLGGRASAAWRAPSAACSSRSWSARSCSARAATSRSSSSPGFAYLAALGDHPPPRPEAGARATSGTRRPRGMRAVHPRRTSCSSTDVAATSTSASRATCRSSTTTATCRRS